MRLWLIVVAGGLVSYGARLSFIGLGSRLTVPPSIERALRYVAPAAFAALSIPLILGGDGVSGFADDVPRIVASVAAVAVIIRWKNMPMSLVIGMLSLWLLQWLVF